MLSNIKLDTAVSRKVLWKKSTKVHATTLKVNVGSSRVTVPWPQDLEIWQKVIVRIGHRVFEFINLLFFFYLLRFIDYQIPRLPIKIVAYTFVLFSDDLSWNSWIPRKQALFLHQPWCVSHGTMDTLKPINLNEGSLNFTHYLCRSKEARVRNVFCLWSRS